MVDAQRETEEIEKGPNPNAKPKCTSKKIPCGVCGGLHNGNKRAGAIARWGVSSPPTNNAKKVIKKRKKAISSWASHSHKSKLSTRRTRRLKGAESRQASRQAKEQQMSTEIEKEKTQPVAPRENIGMNANLADLLVTRLWPSAPRRDLGHTKETCARKEVDLSAGGISLTQRFKPPPGKGPSPCPQPDSRYSSLSEEPSLLSIAMQRAVDAPVSDGLIGDVVQIYHSWPGQQPIWRNVRVESYSIEQDLHLLRFSNGVTDWIDLRTSHVRFPEL